jgi:hypothetical protein
MRHAPHDKRAPTKYTKKLTALRTTAGWPVMGRYKEKAPHKAGVEANRAHMQRLIIQMRINMASANCRSAVANRRTKYDGTFRVSALLGSQPLDHAARASPTRHAQYRHGSRIGGRRKNSTKSAYSTPAQCAPRRAGKLPPLMGP